MLTLVRCYMRYGGENVCAMCGGALDAVSVVNPAFSCFVVDVEVLEVVVEVDGAGAEVSAKEGGVRCEDSGHINMAFAAEGDGEARLPLVKMGDDGCVELARDVLHFDALVWFNPDENGGGSPRLGTMQPDTQTISYRLSHNHAAGLVFPPNSTNRLSIHPTSNADCLYQITKPAVPPQ